MGFPIKDNLISYFSNNEHLFVFVGKEPLPDEFVIPAEDIDPNQRMTIKCRPTTQVSPNLAEQKKAYPKIDDEPALNQNNRNNNHE